MSEPREGSEAEAVDVDHAGPNLAGTDPFVAEPVADGVASAELSADGRAGHEPPLDEATDATAVPPETAGTSASASYGDPRVDAALAELAELADRPVSEHVAVFERIHERFRDALADAAADPDAAAEPDTPAAEHSRVD